MKTRLPAILLALLLAATAIDGTAQKRRSTQAISKKGTPASTAGRPSAPAVAADTLVTVSGYDKTLNASRETMFLTNRTHEPIARLLLTIDYYDASDNCINSRTEWLNVDLPGGATRVVDIPSWDRQHSFYYRHSRRPRTGGIPYTITIRPDSAIILSHPQ